MSSFLDLTGISFSEEDNHYYFKMEKYNDIEIVIHKDFLQGNISEDGKENNITGLVNYPKTQVIFEREIYFNDREYFHHNVSDGVVSILQLFQWAKEILDSKL